MDRFDGVNLRIVQANIPQHLKWHPDYRDQNLQQYLRLSAEAGVGAESVTHVIWPEAAVPFFMGTNNERWRWLTSIVPEDGLLMTGILRRSLSDGAQRHFWNSLVGIDSSANVAFVYDKQHLVPFGEYLPLRGILRALGIEQLAFGPSGYSSGRAGKTPVTVAGLPPFRALICYEVIFPGEIAGKERPSWLLNVTNDAWFGDSPGPYQHFAMARVRAVEQGMALVRAANTGISALVDPYGRVIASLGLDRRGAVDGALPKPLTPPPYARWGDAVFWLLVAFLCIISGLARKTMNPSLDAQKKTDQS
jgi:apolipoprotein N-acyltransferase